MSGNVTVISMATMGVDPGTEGGIAVLDADGAVARVVPIHKEMTESELVAEVGTSLGMLKAKGGGPCFFEKVGYRPTDGGKGAFTFGSITGLLRGALLAFGVRPRYVSPMLWQSRMNCLSGGNKNVTKRRAQELFPGLGKAVTHNTADALLIAEDGRRQSAL